ncbi:putative RNA recognition motif domain, nucleotide-binding alpha-beta plait domain-containing protein [Rosa chinensis]|uniref:Putative RNA recognition motif domain, nucleotide-binding alpha-beta plait domain-containing protein n=1 Tax=Rosa chinensis TaxID=74649 RepID=A0A2P6PHF9_ROSCH|nr:28 kDa ribonucleoprotein, chloroplastic [Rosa chinensis]PRQ21361.1 putative RNA recognition motif domain, nucleotide-binding alpha-beta plait domain-containing protein [Rosa chinensis]
MALLRQPLAPLPCLQNPLHLPKHKPTTLSVSGPLFSLSLSLSHTHHTPTSSIRTKKLESFVLQFSSTAQEEAIEENPVLVEPETEVFSDTRLLAQNVPWTCTPEDIRTMFEKYGTVVDVELAMYNKTRNRGLAFVTMASPEEARVALNSLESTEMDGRIIRMAYAKPKKKKIPPPMPSKDITFNLYVENLSYEVRAKDLREFFTSEGTDIVNAEVVFEGNPRRSAGYAFVSFKSKKEAEAALATFHGKLFMGRKIRVARSKQFVKVPTVKEPAVESSESGDNDTELSSTLEQVIADDSDKK